MKVRAVAQALGCSDAKVRRLIRAGTLQVIPSRGITEVSAESIAAYKAQFRKRCPQCGSNFQGRRTTRVFCSDDCREDAYRQGYIRPGFRRKAPNSYIKIGTCRGCGEEYETTDTRRVYCSIPCRIKHDEAYR